MLDLLFGHVLGIVRFQRHAVVTHAFWSMSAHLHVTVPAYLPVLLIQSIIKG